MDDSDINDIFKDFEHKVEGKQEASASERKKKLEEEESLKERYRKAEQALKEEREMEEKAKHEKAPSKGTPNYERFGYIAVIVVFVAYIGIDLGFYHDGNAAEEQTVTAAAVKTEESGGEQETATEEKQNETVEEEGRKEEIVGENILSGKITFTLDGVDAEVVDADSDLGHINKVVFTIENGKDKNLTPIVDVYAYDSKMEGNWETTSRGEYKGTAIEPGDKRSGSISLVPKTFRNLDIKKSIRLALNDTEDGFITAVNEQVSIS